MGHTPTPWKLYNDDPLVITDAEGSSLGEMTAGDPYISYATQKANAALIVTAVNSHSALLQCAEALREFREMQKLMQWQGVCETEIKAVEAKVDSALLSLEKTNG